MISKKEYKDFLKILLKMINLDDEFSILLNETPQTFFVAHKLGKGNSSTVYKIINLKDHRDSYAVKVIDKNSMLKSSASKRIKEELEILQCFKNDLHPCSNIVKFLTYEDNDIFNSLFIIFECCDTTLQAVLKQHKVIPYNNLKIHAKDILQGLIYIHSKNIVHMDIKPANILIRDNIAKISDFGLSRRNANVPAWYYTGTPNYMAPEVLENKLRTTFEPDIWSFGVLLYVCSVGDAPFQDPNNSVNATFDNIKNCQYTGIHPKELMQDLSVTIINCLTPMNTRPTSVDLGAYEYFKN